MAVIMDLQERGREREGGRAKDAEPREDEGPGRDGDAARQRAPRIPDQPGGAQRCAPGRGCPAAALTPAGAGGEGRAGRPPARPRALGTAGARLRAPRSLRNPARIQRTPWPPPPHRAGVKERPAPLETETKTRGPSRQVKVQDAASPRLLPEGGGDPPRAPRTRRGPASAGFLPRHPLLIKVGSLHDNRAERG